MNANTNCIHILSLSWVANLQYHRMLSTETGEGVGGGGGGGGRGGKGEGEV